jgi:hypothetical protein
MKKTALALVLIFALLFPATGTELVKIAGANAIPYPPTPNTDLPTLVIQTPEPHSPSYANNTLELNFTVIQPNSWDSYYMDFMPTVGRCYGYCYLDGILVNAFPSTQNIVSNYTFVFSNLTSNQHTVKIDVYTLTFSQIDTYQSNVTQTVSFKINAGSQTISFHEEPIAIIRGQYPPSASSPLSEPTPTPPEGSSYSIPAFVIGSVIAIAIGLGLLVYFKKRKQ